MSVVAHVAADALCSASAAAKCFVVIEVDAVNLSSNPCSVFAAPRCRKMINELARSLHETPYSAVSYVLTQS